MKTCTVSEITNYIKGIIETEPGLMNVSIKGELTNVKVHSSGHIYFSIKDDKSVMAGIIFAGNRRNIKLTEDINPLDRTKDGELNNKLENAKVVITGQIKVYEARGIYQIYADSIKLDGVGDLYQRFEELKIELAEMGMFANEYKKPIPKYALKVGIVTAKTGAAIWDICSVAAGRNPYVDLYLYNALVQGDGAKESIVKGIETLDNMDLDVIIVGRGGGSIEDLWAFNEECVARAIFSCKTPVISAVGHEIDYTISDFVADARAETPTAAAVLAVFDYNAFLQDLDRYSDLLREKLQKRVESATVKYDNLNLKLNSKAPRVLLNKKINEAQKIEKELLDKLNFIYNNKVVRYNLLLERLKNKNVLDKFKQGYLKAFTLDKPLLSAENVTKGDEIKIELADGVLNAEVKGVKLRDLKASKENIDIYRK